MRLIQPPTVGRNLHFIFEKGPSPDEEEEPKGHGRRYIAARVPWNHRWGGRIAPPE